jgi:hypothetical protein
MRTNVSSDKLMEDAWIIILKRIWTIGLEGAEWIHDQLYGSNFRNTEANAKTSSSLWAEGLQPPRYIVSHDMCFVLKTASCLLSVSVNSAPSLDNCASILALSYPWAATYNCRHCRGPKIALTADTAEVGHVTASFRWPQLCCNGFGFAISALVRMGDKKWCDSWFI